MASEHPNNYKQLQATSKTTKTLSMPLYMHVRMHVFILSSSSSLYCHRRHHHMIVAVIQCDWGDWGQVEEYILRLHLSCRRLKAAEYAFPDCGEYGRSG